MNDAVRGKYLTLHDLVAEARRKLAPGPCGYLIGATETAATVRHKRHARLDRLPPEAPRALP